MKSNGLTIGLTGGLGSGKSTVAAMLAAHGAHVLSADEIGRHLMQPGEAVFAAFVEHFGPEILLPDGTLNRPALARIAFTDGRVEELNAIVHPATIARQQALAAGIFARDPAALVVVESALIFESKYGAVREAEPWRHRFDKLILVTAPDETKIARFIARAGSGDPNALAAEARRRLAQQIRDVEKASHVDFVIANQGSLVDLQRQVDSLFRQLTTSTRGKAYSSR